MNTWVQLPNGWVELWDEEGTALAQINPANPSPDPMMAIDIPATITPEEFWSRGSWDNLPAFRGEFSLGASGLGDSLYQSVYAKVLATGDPMISQAWTNLTIAIATVDPVGMATGINGLSTMLAQAGHPASTTDINGDTTAGDTHDGWNTICDRYNLPTVVEAMVQGVPATFSLRLA